MSHRNQIYPAFVALTILAAMASNVQATPSIPTIGPMVEHAPARPALEKIAAPPRRAPLDVGPRFPMYGPANRQERELIYTAIHHCDNAGARHAKPYLMLELLRLEAEAEIPKELRGITLAAWCGEAAYQTEDIVGDGGRAVGILQLHPHITRACGDPDLRHHPIASAQCWLAHLTRVHSKSTKRCGKKKAWKAAELWLSQGGLKSGYSCTRKSGHVARLERWQRMLRRAPVLASYVSTR